MNRRGFLAFLGAAAAVAVTTAGDAKAFLTFEERRKRLAEKQPGIGKVKKKKKAVTAKKTRKPARPAYDGRELVDFSSPEKPGTIIVKTRERALYHVMGDGKAMRYMIAVGKEGFNWYGTARVGLKREWPKWTPPAEMIKRMPQYAKWKNGMPGGPKNPLGARALYLFTKQGDTMLRIHGTNAPSSIGTAASSGCFRMLNHEVIELYSKTPVGTKVIVL